MATDSAKRPDLGPGLRKSERQAVARPLCEKSGIARIAVRINGKSIAAPFGKHDNDR